MSETADSNTPQSNEMGALGAHLRRVTRPVLAIVLGANMSAGLLANTEDSPGPELVTTYDANGCVVPALGEGQHILQLVKQPENPLITSETVGGGKGGDPHQAAQAFRQEVAQQAGVTIYDATPLLDQLANEDDGSPAATERYLFGAQAFMSLFGVDVRVGNAGDQLYYGEQVLTEEEMQDPAFKISLAHMIAAYSNLPLEYVKYAGLKHIVLMGDFKQNVAAYALMDDQHDTEHFNMSLPLEKGTYLHELGHHYHRTLCDDPRREASSGFGNDTAFESIDGGNPHLYDGTAPDGHDLESYEQLSQQDFLRALQAAAKGDIKTACSILQLDNGLAAQVNTVSWYHPNGAEGTAEMLRLLSDPEQYRNLFSSHSPTLMAEAVFEMARIATVSPGIATYFLAVGRRASDPTNITCPTPPSGPR